MRASSFLGGICFLAKTLYHKGVGVLNFHLSLQNEKKYKEDYMKKLLIMSLVLMLLLVVGCSADNNESTAPEKIFTIDELAAFNGKDGAPAYIAVDGIVYDVTNVSYWRNGMHNGFEAGRDLTEEIKTISPHGVSKMKGIPVIGKLSQ
jgi:predicted heme/steroid binding protein